MSDNNSDDEHVRQKFQFRFNCVFHLFLDLINLFFVAVR